MSCWSILLRFFFQQKSEVLRFVNYVSHVRTLLCVYVCWSCALHTEQRHFSYFNRAQFTQICDSNIYFKISWYLNIKSSRSTLNECVVFFAVQTVSAKCVSRRSTFYALYEPSEFCESLFAHFDSQYYYFTGGCRSHDAIFHGVGQQMWPWHVRSLLKIFIIFFLLFFKKIYNNNKLFSQLCHQSGFKVCVLMFF